MAIFKKFDHIGVVVEDLPKAMDVLTHFFELESREVMEIKDAGIRIAFYPLGSGQMELIEFQKPIEGVDPIVTRPGGGVQHLPANWRPWPGGLLLSDRRVGSVDRDM
jgi:hypothetical protein